MPTFLGSSIHRLDEKGRLTLPRRILDEVAKANQVFTITGGFDGCLLMLDREGWQEVTTWFGKRVLGGRAERALRRRFLGHAETVEPDRSHRVPLPRTLRQFAGIGEGTEVVLMGTGRCIEIWANDRLVEALEKGDPSEEKFFEECLVGATAEGGTSTEAAEP